LNGTGFVAAAIFTLPWNGINSLVYKNCFAGRHRAILHKFVSKDKLTENVLALVI
jgi:hypothetical protein